MGPTCGRPGWAGRASCVILAAAPPPQETSMAALDYSEASRALQERFDTRRLADALTQVIVHEELTDMDQAFIGSRDMFWLASVDAQGAPTRQLQGRRAGLCADRRSARLAVPVLRRQRHVLLDGQCGGHGAGGPAVHGLRAAAPHPRAGQRPGAGRPGRCWRAFRARNWWCAWPSPPSSRTARATCTAWSGWRHPATCRTTRALRRWPAGSASTRSSLCSHACEPGPGRAGRRLADDGPVRRDGGARRSAGLTCRVATRPEGQSHALSAARASAPARCCPG